MPLDKNAIIKDAQKYIARGQIEKAISEWQKLLKETPNDGNLYNTIGDLYLRIKAQKEAIESYRKAAGILQKDGFTLKAMALYKKIININPTQIDATVALADLNAERGLVGNANENYLSAAEYYTKEGSVAKALEVYERMVNLNPGNINLRLRLAEMYIREGFPEEGINKYTETASTYLEKGETQKAKETYNKVLGYRPKNLDALKGLCTIYQKEGGYREAYDIINKALELFPEKKDLHLLYGKTAFHVGKLDEAKNVFIKLIDSDPGNEDAREFLARVYLKEGKKDAALGELKTVLDGLVQKDELEGATTLLQEMIDIDPENSQLHNNLIDIYIKLGKEENVKKEYEFLASIYINKGDKEKAANILKTLIDLAPSTNEYRRKLEELERPISEEILAVPTMEEEPSEEKVVEESVPVEDIKIVPEITEVKNEREVMAEADVYIRYGLIDKAIETIRTFIDVNPENIKGRIALKNIYKSQVMKTEFIDECIALADMYQREGNEKERVRILNEAFEMGPEDERILTRLSPKIFPEEEEKEIETLEQEIAPEIEEEVREETVAGKEIIPEALEERIAEADFYSQQGLFEEALKVYRDILKLQPVNEDIRKKIAALSGTEEKVEEIAFIKKEPEAVPIEEMPEAKAGEALVKEGTETLPVHRILRIRETPEEKPEKISFVKEPEAVILEEPTEEFIDFATELREEIETGAPKSPFEDKNLQEIFQEFKKGVDREIGEKDYDTHYNLGIAYKEMGLIDEAIGEFQASAKDPSLYVQALSMLGICFMEKELYQLAIKEFKKALDAVGEGTEEYMGLKYDLGIAYEKAGMFDEALSMYTDVYGMDAKFREISSKIEKLKKTVVEVTPEKAVVSSEKKIQKPKKNRVSYL